MSKNKIRWTGIDTFIVLAVIAVIAVVGLKFGPSMFTNAKNDKVEFTVMIQTKDEELAKAITPGSKATLSLTEKDGGIIKDVRTEQAMQMTYNSIDGTYTNEAVEGKVDIYVTVEADCAITDEYIKTGDTAVKVGAELPVRGKGFATSGFVININD